VKNLKITKPKVHMTQLTNTINPTQPGKKVKPHTAKPIKKNYNTGESNTVKNVDF
jgi:hypothetical protein